MRSAVDLVDLPFSFTQLRPLLSDGFIREARDRGVPMTLEQLEGFHRLRLLTPLLRVRRDGRRISSAARGGDLHVAAQLGREHPTSISDLQAARREGRLYAPAREAFVARRRLVRRAGGRTYRSSEYLYSHHQLLHLAPVRAALPFLKYGRSGSVTGLDAARWWRAPALERARQLDEVIVAVSALEPVYYPQVIQGLRLDGHRDFAQYDRWRKGLPVTWALRWLDVDAAWVREAAAELLRRADGIDPLGRWLDVVREADPSSWKLLRGEARTALDLRIAGDVLLRYYDDLAEARRAPRLPPRAPRVGGRFDTRLKSRGGLDRVLTRFGLSPHPRLLLVVEGDTELMLFPRVMRYFELRTDPDFLAIENQEGVRKDVTALIAYAAAPRVELEEDRRYLRLVRRPTRILVVTDAEGKMSTADEREKKRADWIDRLLRTLPLDQRTENVRNTLGLLVHVDTWNARGESFEFAHFTDRQLARAIAQLDTRDRQPSLAERAIHVAGVRAASGNLKKLLPSGCSKLELADALWPVLEAKIQRAERHGSEARIPSVRILDRATDLAREFVHGTFVIPLAGD